MRILGALLLVVCLCVPAFAWAEDPPLLGPPPPVAPDVIARDGARITLRTMRVPSPLTFDGTLDEPFYRDVPSFGDFVQQEPREGAPATEKTEVWVFYDRDYLYVSARVWESEPGRRIATEMRRDANNIGSGDHFAVTFDPFYDRRNGYGFVVNPIGGMLDWMITNEQPNNSWNGVWDARTGTFDNGWTVEIRFPFRSFRIRENGHVWGINFRRMARWKNETSMLTPVPAAWGRPGMSHMSIAASLTGLETPGRGLNIDLKPYALGSLLTDRNASPAYSNDPDGNVGFDLKWKMRQTLIADVTVNTDFAQVEDDEAQVNLTRFSLQFPEKRDFFLEGADTFSFGSGGSTGTAPLLFYSRRIGLNNGTAVPIRAGGRLLGQSGPWRYGLLNIQTAESEAGRAASTNFTVARVNRDLFTRSRIGAILTRRDPLASIGPGASSNDNLAYGLDTNINPTRNISILGWAARTETPGRTGDDASYRGRFDWNADRYGVQGEYMSVGADFNPEVGLLRRSAFKRSYGQARFSPRPTWRGIRKVYYQASVDYITDPLLRPESKELQGSYQMDLNNGDTWGVEATRTYERLERPFSVGKGVSVPRGEYSADLVRATYTLGGQRPVSGSITTARGGYYGGTLTEVTWRGRVELTPQFYTEPTISFNHVDVSQGTANSNLFSTRATYTLSPRMFVSALVQYQSRTDSFTSNARFRWEYLPGSELFIVYSDGRTTLDSRGFPDLQNRSFVVKVTRLLRW